ncbi:hypothetical protein TrCOL_g11405 [Triparma columacea]|uniref:Uncharacterized protein n=1 Tax=Triparma columacea TaxID=722753 RepID=A0A9W7FVR9_9STRA|nr:hypothetical protein TrCOL_g11405 [Triparma columacea]
MAVSNLRDIGMYKGEVYVVTDDKDRTIGGGGGGGKDVLGLYDVIEVKDEDKIVGKAIKSKVLEYLPEKCVNVIYLDTDVFFTQDTLRPKEDYYQVDKIGKTDTNKPTSTSQPLEPLPKPTGLRFELSGCFTSLSSTTSGSSHAVACMFLDAKGHVAGFCSGCDKWHTGFIGLRRGSSEGLLKEWGDGINRGEGDITDQSVMDIVMKDNGDWNGVVLGYDKMVFMRDYIRIKIGVGEEVELQHYTGLGEGGGEWNEVILENLGMVVGDYVGQGGAARRTQGQVREEGGGLGKGI